jgi:hypothetical protein
MKLKLSDIKVGTYRKPTKYEKVGKGYENVPQDPVKQLVDGLLESSSDYGSDYSTITTTPLQTRVISIGPVAQKNYLSYLNTCWAQHLGAVITPDIVWYMLLTEIASVVKGNAEKYRSLFSTSDKKQTILVQSSSIVEMPMDKLVDMLTSLVPTESSVFMPQFSTSTPSSQHAMQCAFADLCSPYYNYGMFLCDIPCIDVRGTREDWLKVAFNWEKLSEVVPVGTWSQEVLKLLKEVAENIENAAFWKKMFWLESCGSGHQTEVRGWITKLFISQPQVAYASNFSTQISVVKYKQVDLDLDYDMKVGLFSSTPEGDFLVPDFGHVIFERLKTPSVVHKSFQTEIVVLPADPPKTLK